MFGRPSDVWTWRDVWGLTVTFRPWDSGDVAYLALPLFGHRQSRRKHPDYDILLGSKAFSWNVLDQERLASLNEQTELGALRTQNHRSYVSF